LPSALFPPQAIRLNAAADTTSAKIISAALFFGECTLLISVSPWFVREID
jgi:hypothetical protein